MENRYNHPIIFKQNKLCLCCLNKMKSELGRLTYTKEKVTLSHRKQRCCGCGEIDKIVLFLEETKFYTPIKRMILTKRLIEIYGLSVILSKENICLIKGSDGGNKAYMKVTVSLQ